MKDTGSPERWIHRYVLLPEPIYASHLAETPKGLTVFLKFRRSSNFQGGKHGKNHVLSLLGSGPLEKVIKLKCRMVQEKFLTVGNTWAYRRAEGMCSIQARVNFYFSLTCVFNVTRVKTEDKCASCYRLGYLEFCRGRATQGGFEGFGPAEH